jgi:hypothetical protein
MKRKLFKSVLSASAVAMICACGDDAASSNPVNPISDSPCARVVVTANAWVFNTGSADVVIYADGNVTNAVGQPFGYFDPTTGVVMDLNGSPIATGVDVAALTACVANATVDPNTGAIEKFSSSSVATNPTDPTDPTNPTSSAGIFDPTDPTNPTSSAGITDPTDPTNPTSSAGVTDPTDPTSSAGTEPVEVSSSSAEPVKTTGNPEEDIKNYPVPTLKNILGNGTSGWNTRYWDACKPHCSQTSTDGEEGKPKITSQEVYEASHYTARVCNINDIEIPTFTYSKGLERYWVGIQNTPNACQEADPASGGGFTCTDMAPVAVNDTLAYAFVAGSDATTSCGKCFHLQYDGSFHDASASNGAKATHKALKGKHIIVMASNIGHDVKPGQFDLMVPGGGPGIFNALQLQITKPGIEWGATYGGFLTYCQNNDKCGYDGTLDCYQTCVKEMCDAAFGDSKYPNLLRGCHWFADWFMAADNPTYQWEEVDCPQYLIDKYSTTISTSIETKILFQSDWSKYKGGDFITTDACSNTPNAQGEYCDPEQLAADKAKTY